MEEAKPRSKLYVLEPLVRKLPEIEVPKRRVSFKERFLWTGVVLAIFFVMAAVPLYGMIRGPSEFFGYLRYVLASHAGTIVELGIGPIVTAGIIMQLLVGSKIIGLNLREPEDRALFTGVQKIAAIVMAVFQASMFVFGGWYGGRAELGLGRMLFLILQLVFGSVILIYLDELVSKYGFGSGISLFIAGGVAAEIFWRAFTPIGPEYGAVPNLIRAFIPGSPVSIHDAFFTTTNSMMGVLAMLMVFFIVVYIENLRVEIPLAYGRFGGVRGRYPIKFMYTSVIPVILAMTLFANLRILAMLMEGRGYPFLGTVGGGGVPATGFVSFLSPPEGIGAVMAEPLRAAVYLAILAVTCIGFAWLWVQMTGMGPRDVAEQLYESGLSIPGFRRDVRVMGWVLGRYINTVTILSGVFIAVVACLADFTGALGSGTGILLTVGIIYGLYEEIARERVSEMFPAMRRLFGE